MECQYCKSRCVKNGIQKTGTQKYRCLHCRKYQQKTYKNQACLKSKKDLIIPLIIHNCGFRATAEVLKLSVNTVRSTIFTEAAKCQPPCVPPGGIYEVDELCAYRKVGEREIWACYAIEKRSRKIIGISVGRRKRSMIRKTISEVLANRPKKIYTDGFTSYRRLVPPVLHKQLSLLLSLIERAHLEARNSLKMLNRKTLAFVRRDITLLACLKLLFWWRPAVSVLN